MNHNAPDEVIEAEAQPADPVDVFHLEWARETLKRNLPFANEVLRSLMTLSATMLGGSIAFLDRVSSPWARIVAIICFLLALIASLLGVRPFEGTTELQIPSRIKEHKEKALKKKQDCLRWAGSLLYLGFLVALLGVLTHS